MSICVTVGPPSSTRRGDFYCTVLYSAHKTVGGGWVWRRAAEHGRGTGDYQKAKQAAQEYARQSGLPFIEGVRHNYPIASDAVAEMLCGADRCYAPHGGLGRFDAVEVGDASCRDSA